MSLNQTPPNFTVGVDAKGRLICQEENLEPSIVKALENMFLIDIKAKANQNFTLAASEIDKLISFGTITDAKVLFVHTQGNITMKVNSIGSSPIPVCPYALIMGNNAGITELYLTNLGTDVAVQVFVGA